MLIAASVFFVAGLGYAVWCVVVTINRGPHVGSIGMALLAAALCYQGLSLFQGSSRARVAGIVSASAFALSSGAAALLLALPWLSAADERAIPAVLWPTLALLLATATAFTVAATLLIRDLRQRH